MSPFSSISHRHLRGFTTIVRVVSMLRLLPLLMRMAVWTPHLDLHGAVSRWQALERSGVLRRSGSDGLGIGEKGLEVEVGVVVARLEEENVSKHSPMI